MPLTATAFIHQSSPGNNNRRYQVDASTQDTAAGQAVTLTVSHSTVGAIPPGRATYLAVRLYRNVDSGVKTQVKQFEISIPTATVDLSDASFPQAFTFYLTDTGESGGGARSGTLELAIYGKRLDTFSAVVWELESDGSPSTAQTTFTASFQRAAIRGTTTAALTPSSTTWAYPEAPTLTADLAAPSYEARTLTLVAGPSSGASNSTTDFFARTVTVNNVFPTASTVYTPSITVPSSLFADMAWTTLTTTTQAVTVDPRITFDQHGQKNLNTYATPPVDSGTNRLTTDLWFLSTRALNSKGVGITTLGWTSKLWDAGELVGTEAAPVTSRSSTASTQGGEVGWADGFVAWDEGLPSGTWYFKHVITTSGATGLESNGTHSFALLAINPNYGLIVGGGPVGAAEGDHFHAGDTLQVGVALVNFSTRELLTPDASPAPSVIIGRFSSEGHVEYLEDDLVTWSPVVTTANEITLMRADLVLPGANPKVYITIIPDSATATWTEPTQDIFVLGRAATGGTPYSNSATTPVLAGVNGHVGGTLEVHEHEHSHAATFALTGAVS